MPRKRKSGKRNTLICSIPGLSKAIEIGFESKKLPVCKRCKKIYKTRQLCRVRDEHTEIPWNTTYICFEVHDSCLVNGKFVQAEGDKFVAEILPEKAIQAPYFADLDKLGPDPPICRDCKEKNYTRYHCRTNHCHTKMPWGAFYAVLKRIKNEVVTTAIHSDGADSVDGGISVPTLESPRPDRGFKDIRNSMDSLCQPLKRQNSYSFEEQHYGKRIKSEDKMIKPLVETVMNGNESSKAFVLIIHDEETSLHWLKTSQSDTELHLSPSMESHHESALTQSHGNSYQSSNHEIHHSSMYDNTYSNNNQHYHPASNFHPQNMYHPGNGINEDANGIEPMPYCPPAHQGSRPNQYYTPNDNCYMHHPQHDRSPYPARGHADTSQYGYSHSNAYAFQVQAPYNNYRQPPIPHQQLIYNDNGPDTRHSYHPHQQYENNTHNGGYHGNEDPHGYKYQQSPSREIDNGTQRDGTEESSDGMQMIPERRRNAHTKNETYLTSWTDGLLQKDDDTGNHQGLNEMELLTAGDDGIISL